MNEMRRASAARIGYRFTVPGKPRGKGRPRFRRAGNFVSTYTPKETAAYENLVALEYQAVGGKMIEGPVEVEVLAIYPIPKSAKRQDKEDMLRDEILPSCKPDADNVLKAVLDGLNGVAYPDDTHVVRAVIDRGYGEVGELRVNVWHYGGRFRK